MLKELTETFRQKGDREIKAAFKDKWLKKDISLSAVCPAAAALCPLTSAPGAQSSAEGERQQLLLDVGMPGAKSSWGSSDPPQKKQPALGKLLWLFHCVPVLLAALRSAVRSLGAVPKMELVVFGLLGVFQC